MAEYTQQFAEFLRDAEAAGYVVLQPDPNACMLLLARGADAARVGCAQILYGEWDGKKRFYKGEPIGGARTLDDFWTMKGLRERFRIPRRK